MATTSAEHSENELTATGAFVAIQVGDDVEFNETEAMPTSTPVASPVVIASVQPAGSILSAGSARGVLVPDRPHG